MGSSSSSSRRCRPALRGDPWINSGLQDAASAMARSQPGFKIRINCAGLLLVCGISLPTSCSARWWRSSHRPACAQLLHLPAADVRPQLLRVVIIPSVLHLLWQYMVLAGTLWSDVLLQHKKQCWGDAQQRPQTGIAHALN